MGLLDGLLGQVLGGAQQGSQRGSPDLGDLLGQVLGGGRQGGERGSPDLGDILGSLGGGDPGPGGAPRSGGMTSGMGGAAIGSLIAIALQMLQKNGGLEAILGRLQQQGHASEAESWVGGGSNTPLSPDVLEQIFGREEIGRAAQQMGVSEGEAAGGLAAIFPEIVNQMTPQGRVESGSDDVVARALEELQRAKR